MDFTLGLLVGIVLFVAFGLLVTGPMLLIVYASRRRFRRH